MKTQMVCIGGNLVVYKTYTLGQNKIVESAALSDEETKNLFNTVMKDKLP
jgi:hypothetical protein